MNEADILGKHRIPRLLAPSRDTHTNWNTKDPIIPEGVYGITFDRLFDGSAEYFIGDGIHKYSELTKYGGAEASATSKANTLVLRDGNGKIDKASLPNDLTDLVNIPDATPTTKGIVKASTTKAADNAVKSDANGSLDGWKDAISSAVANPSAGLVKNSDGTLGVDFDQMPTDKFEALLASLKMLIPLDANLNLYVDTNNAAAGDSIIDGRGTQQKPFKTIQACVNYVTGKYALGPYKVTIYIGAGTYDENITLPDYSRTTGNITLIPVSDQRDVKIKSVLNSAGERGTCVLASGGVWNIYNIEAERTENPITSTYSPLLTCFESYGSGTELYLRGCSAVQKLPDDASIMANSNSYSVVLLCADMGALLDISNSSIETNISAEKSATKPANTYVLLGRRQSTIQFHRTTTSPVINVDGSCNIFLSLSNQTQILHFGNGSNLSFSGSMTGTRYEFTKGGHSDMDAAADYFPGDVAGTVESNTYCYY